jgi:hypothetical protein
VIVAIRLFYILIIICNRAAVYCGSKRAKIAKKNAKSW